MTDRQDSSADTFSTPELASADYPKVRRLGRLFRRIPLFRAFFAERDGFREKILVLANKLRIQDKRLRDEIQRITLQRDRYMTKFAPGHHYSVVPGQAELRAREATIYGPVEDHIPGVDLNKPGQLQLLESLAQYYGDLPFSPEPQPGVRYYYENANFSYADAIALYSMIRHLKPRRIVEVGCGFSSCVSIDTNERFFRNEIQLTFVDPFPQLLHALMRPGDAERVRIIQNYVQDVPLQAFTQLEANDILFIDSSHVLRTAGDLTHLLFHVLPHLKPGVYVHFHDVPYPFEYPPEWVFGGRAWNECYALRAFLQHNNAYEIVYFNSYLMRFNRAFFEESMPLCLRNPGGSLWLRKTGAAVTPEPRYTVVAEFQPSPKFDAVNIAHPQQLGRGWYECDGDLAARWMGLSAEVVLSAPDRPGKTVRLAGFLQHPTGATLTLSGDTLPIGVTFIPQGHFRISFKVPEGLVGRERFVLRLELDKTHRVEGDDRDLGISFGTIEIA